MKRLIICLTLLVASLGGVAAKEVPVDRALRIASQLLGETTRGGALSVVWDSSALANTRSGSDVPTFYVVAPESAQGFVIVAGDDAITPILAYSTRYSAPSASVLPPNFEEWLNYVDSAVRYVRDRGIVADAATQQLWSEGYEPVDAIMLNTARWSQLAPYNNECPLDDGARSLTGCTQTATAIIMHHNRWPERAQGVTESFTTLRKGIYVPARDLNHAYDWDNMLEIYIEGEYSDVEAEAVAILMADLGYAFRADYTSVDTGALPDMLALYEKFGYSPATRITRRATYSDEYWNALLRSEIEAGYPIFYSGYTEDDAGHAFVLDGVDQNNYFHVNWGWGGVYDGFFLLDALTLDNYEFDYTQWALFGMRPMRDGEVDNWLCLSSSGLRASTTTFEKGVSFTIEPATVANYSQLHFDGEVRVGVCDSRGEWKSWATEPHKLSLPSMYGGGTSQMSAVVMEDILMGDRLSLFYRSNTSDKWFKMSAFAEGTVDEVIMKYPTIGSTTSFDYDKVRNTIIVDYDDDVKSALYLNGQYVEDGVTITKGKMTIATQRLMPGSTYTILLVREGVEQRELTFTIKAL